MRSSIIALVIFALIGPAGCSTSEPERIATPLPPTNAPPPTNTPIPTNTSLPPTDTPVPEIEVVGNPERGREIFENGGSHGNYQKQVVRDTSLCTRCHTVDGSAEKEHLGPQMQGISERAANRVPGLSAAQYIYQSLKDPRAYVVEGYSFMAVKHTRLLSEEEVADLVAFLLTQ